MGSSMEVGASSQDLAAVVIHESPSLSNLSMQPMAAKVSGDGLDGGDSFYVDASEGFNAD